MKFDDILGEIGEFGRYQRWQYVMVCIMAIPVGFHQMAQVFLASSQDHWCKVEAWGNEDCSSWGLSPELCMEAKRNATVPLNATDTELHCRKYETVDDLVFSPSLDPTSYIDQSIIACNDGWEYDRSQVSSSIISEFDLVCSDSRKDSLAQSLFFVGVLIGSVLFGSLSDIFGRRRSLVAAIVMLGASGMAVAFSPNYWFYTIFRIIVATANMGLFLVAFVIGTEFVGPSKRTIAGIVIEFFFALGYMLLAVLAYFIRDWWILQLVITIPVFLLLLMIPFLPESPRWLIIKGRTEDASKIIQKAARVNKTKLPEPIFTAEDIKEQQIAATAKQATGLDLFKTPNLRMRTLNCMFNWFVNVLVYYGLSLSTSDLGVNVYVAFGISGAVEFPAYLTCIFAVDYFGRRWSMFMYMVGGGIACLCTIFTPLGIARTTVAMIGKFSITGSFAIIYIYSAELFPTPVRSVGIGVCSMSSRIAGILSPIILLLSETWQPLPVLIFGIMSIIAGILVLLLPETCGAKLPETLEEGELFGTKLGKSDNDSVALSSYKTTNGNVEETKEGVINKAFDNGGV